MREHEVILKDLKKFLKGKGVKTEVSFRSFPFDQWEISFSSYIFRYFYRVGGGMIQGAHDEESIVSLADPQYRHKFAKHLKREIQRWNKA